MPIKAIILDMDGTLLSDQQQISPRTKESLIRAQQKGVKVVLASGRPTSGMMAYAKELEMEKHHGLLVSYNGARIIDCENQKELYNQSLTIEEGKAVLEHLKQFDVKIMIDKEEYMYVNDVFDCWVTYRGEPLNIIEYESRAGNYLLCEKKDLADFLDFPVSKILTAGDPEYLREMHQEMMAPFKDDLHCVFTADFYFEFTAKGINKAKALETVLVPLGIERANMLAFGDGHNDITMVEYAGIGVAMDNAVGELKQTADRVTDSNNQDGIALVVEELVLQASTLDAK
ncbi:Cof-type HAD-IIB family hydrolase [Enterococcus florum]|nr:Cof-type HAD-IIB family hydrolase [Enterococcus florum]